MKEVVVLKINKTFKNTLTSVRDITAIGIAEYDGNIWAKYVVENETTKNRLFEVRFEDWYVLKQNYLFKSKQITPEMAFFSTKWEPIGHYFPVTLPPVAMGAKLPHASVVLQLKDHHVFETPVALLVEKSELKAYLKYAPNFRYNALTYAESTKGQVLLLGTPLLPIQGTAYWKYKDVLLPCGKILDSKMHTAMFNMKIGGTHIIFITPQVSYQIISKQHIKTLTRKSIIC